MENIVRTSSLLLRKRHVVDYYITNGYHAIGDTQESILGSMILTFS